MIDGIISKVLSSVLADYIDAIDSKKLNTQLFAGKASLESLSIKPTALQHHDLPVEVSKGLIGKIDLSFPWRNLTGQACVATISDINIVAHICGQQALQNELNALKNQYSNIDSALVDEKPQSGEALTGTVATVVSNLRFFINNVHIRIEQKVGDSLFAAGIIIPSIRAFTVDCKGNEVMVSGEESTIRKKAILENFSIYLDPNTNPIPTDTNFHKEMVIEAARTHSYVLKNFTVSANITHCKGNKVTIDTSQIYLALSREQWCGIREMQSQHSKFSRQVYFLTCGHPDRFPKSPRSSGLWWRYSFNCAQKKLHPFNFNPKKALTFLKNRTKQFKAVQNYLKADDKEKVKSIADDIEDKFGADVFQMFQIYTKWKTEYTIKSKSETAKALKEDLTKSLRQATTESDHNSVNLVIGDIIADLVGVGKINLCGIQGSLLMNDQSLQINANITDFLVNGDPSMPTILKLDRGQDKYCLDLCYTSAGGKDASIVFNGASPVLRTNQKFIQELTDFFTSDAVILDDVNVKIKRDLTRLEIEKKISEYKKMNIKAHFNSPQIISGKLQFLINSLDAKTLDTPMPNADDPTTFFDKYDLKLSGFMIKVEDQPICEPVDFSAVLSQSFIQMSALHMTQVKFNMSALEVNLTRAQYLTFFDLLDLIPKSENSEPTRQAAIANDPKPESTLSILADATFEKFKITLDSKTAALINGFGVRFDGRGEIMDANLTVGNILVDSNGNKIVQCGNDTSSSITCSFKMLKKKMSIFLRSEQPHVVADLPSIKQIIDFFSNPTSQTEEVNKQIAKLSAAKEIKTAAEANDFMTEYLISNHVELDLDLVFNAPSIVIPSKVPMNMSLGCFTCKSIPCENRSKDNAETFFDSMNLQLSGIEFSSGGEYILQPVTIDIELGVAFIQKLDLEQFRIKGIIEKIPIGFSQEQYKNLMEWTEGFSIFTSDQKPQQKAVVEEDMPSSSTRLKIDFLLKEVDLHLHGTKVDFTMLNLNVNLNMIKQLELLVNLSHLNLQEIVQIEGETNVSIKGSEIAVRVGKPVIYLDVRKIKGIIDFFDTGRGKIERKPKVEQVEEQKSTDEKEGEPMKLDVYLPGFSFTLALPGYGEMIGVELALNEIPLKIENNRLTIKSPNFMMIKCEGRTLVEGLPIDVDFDISTMNGNIALPKVDFSLDKRDYQILMEGLDAYLPVIMGTAKKAPKKVKVEEEPKPTDSHIYINLPDFHLTFTDSGSPVTAFNMAGLCVDIGQQIQVKSNEITAFEGPRQWISIPGFTFSTAKNLLTVQLLDKSRIVLNQKAIFFILSIFIGKKEKQLIKYTKRFELPKRKESNDETENSTTQIKIGRTDIEWPIRDTVLNLNLEGVFSMDDEKMLVSLIHLTGRFENYKPFVKCSNIQLTMFSANNRISAIIETINFCVAPLDIASVLVGIKDFKLEYNKLGVVPNPLSLDDFVYDENKKVVKSSSSSFSIDVNIFNDITFLFCKANRTIFDPLLKLVLNPIRFSLKNDGFQNVIPITINSLDYVNQKTGLWDMIVEPMDIKISIGLTETNSNVHISMPSLHYNLSLDMINSISDFISETNLSVRRRNITLPKLTPLRITNLSGEPLKLVLQGHASIEEVKPGSVLETTNLPSELVKVFTPSQDCYNIIPQELQIPYFPCPTLCTFIDKSEPGVNLVLQSLARFTNKTGATIYVVKKIPRVMKADTIKNILTLSPMSSGSLPFTVAMNIEFMLTDNVNNLNGDWITLKTLRESCTINASFNNKKRLIHLSNTFNVQHCHASVTLLPIASIQNQLPFSIWWSYPKCADVVEIPSGKTMPTIDQPSKILLGTSPKGLHPVTISLKDESITMWNVSNVFDAAIKTTIPLKGCTSLIIFAPTIIYNLTSYPINVISEDEKRTVMVTSKDSIPYGYSSFFSDRKVPSMKVYFSSKLGDRGHKTDAPIECCLPDVSQGLLIPRFNKGEPLYFPVHYTIERQDPMLSTYITITPHFKIRNKMDVGFNLTPLFPDTGKPMNHSIFVSPHAEQELHFTTKSYTFNFELQGKGKNPTTIVLSHPVKVTIAYKLETGPCFIDLDIVQSDYDLIACFSKATIQSPIVCVNMTNDLIKYQQHGTDYMIDVPSKSSRVVGYVNPFETTDLDIVDKTKSTTTLSIATINMPIKSKLFVSEIQIASNGIKQIMISDEIMPHEVRSKFYIGVNVQSIQLSFIDSDFREFMNVTVSDFGLLFMSDGETTRLTSSISKLQIDDVHPMSQLQVAVASDPTSKQFMFLNCTMPSRAPMFSAFNEIEFRTSQIYAYADLNFINDVMFFFESFMKTVKDTTITTEEEPEGTLDFQPTSNRSAGITVQLLKLHEIEINASVRSMTGRPSAFKLVSNFLRAVPNISGAEFKTPGIQCKDLVMSKKAIQTDLIEPIKSALVAQIMKAFFNLDIFLNPVAMTNNCTRHFDRLVHGNVVAIAQVPTSVVLNLGESALLSASKVMHFIAFDDGSAQNVSTLNASSKDAMLSGARAAGMGFVDGITGIITDPIKGAREEGVGGFFKGLGKGLTGVVTKPVMGMVDGVTGLVAGFQIMVDGDEHVVRRIRPGRAFPQGKILPYDKFFSDLQAKIQESSSTSLFKVYGDYLRFATKNQDNGKWFVVTQRFVVETTGGKKVKNTIALKSITSAQQVGCEVRLKIDRIDIRSLNCKCTNEKTARLALMYITSLRAIDVFGNL